MDIPPEHSCLASAGMSGGTSTTADQCRRQLSRLALRTAHYSALCEIVREGLRFSLESSEDEELSSTDGADEQLTDVFDEVKSAASWLALAVRLDAMTPELRFAVMKAFSSFDLTTGADIGISLLSDARAHPDCYRGVSWLGVAQRMLDRFFINEGLKTTSFSETERFSLRCISALWYAAELGINIAELEPSDECLAWFLDHTKATNEMLGLLGNIQTDLTLQVLVEELDPETDDDIEEIIRQRERLIGDIQELPHSIPMDLLVARSESARPATVSLLQRIAGAKSAEEARRFAAMAIQTEFPSLMF